MKKTKRLHRGGGLLCVNSPGVRILNGSVVLLWSVIIILPLVMVFFMSFKTNTEVGYSGIFSPPQSFLNLDNYLTFISRSKIFQAYKNTFILIFCSVPVSLLLAAMASYVLDRFDFLGKELISALFTCAVMIPNITTQIVIFKMIQSLGVYNTRWAGVILFTAVDIVQIYMFRQFVRNVPRELDESAMIDGAGVPAIFFRIVLPQLAPAFATTAILKALSIYNDMFIAYLYMPDTALRTVSQSIRLFTNDYGGQWNVISAGVMLIMLPTLLVYLFTQRWIVNDLTGGAVKG